MKHVIRHLRRAALLSVEEGPPDAQLLESFLVRRDEVAFEALLRRHGPMVLGVCQRVLRNVHDAEDALQATFLVFARKAGSIRSRQVVASWLYGVAYRTAMKARTMNAKRRAKERQVGEMPRSKPSADEELLAQLDHELSRLPDKYRVPIVLCELEGRSRKEVARLLSLPEGTLSSRLAQAKKLLAKRLSRNELAISLGVLAVGLSPTLRASTLKTVLTAGAVPAKVLVLTEGVIKAMLLSKLKMTMCAGALMALVGVGASGLTYRATAQASQPRETLASRSQADELDALRLEIEALRKSLQATRERVKTLEGEVSTLKGQRHGLQGELQAARGQAAEPDIPAAWVDEQLNEHATIAKLRAQADELKEILETFRAKLKNPEEFPSYQANSRRLKKVEAQLAAERKRLRPVIVHQLQGKMHGQGVGSGRGAGGQPPRGSGMIDMKMGTMPRMPGSPDTGQSMAGMMQKATKSDPVTDAENALKKLRANPGDKQATEALERALRRLKEQDKQNQPGETPLGK